MAKRSTAFFQDTELFVSVMNVSFVHVSPISKHIVIIIPLQLLNPTFTEQLVPLMTITSSKLYKLNLHQKTNCVSGEFLLFLPNMLHK